METVVESKLVPFSTPVAQAKHKRTAGIILRFFFYPQKENEFSRISCLFMPFVVAKLQ